MAWGQGRKKAERFFFELLLLDRVMSEISHTIKSVLIQRGDVPTLGEKRDKSNSYYEQN